jgi:thiol-disulfide isomerase/thioredoxin
VFIDFYADWCVPCLKMQKEVFTHHKIIGLLNKNYYSVKMNVETKDTITFGNQVYTNERMNKRNPVHQIPILMASQKNKPFSLPAIVLMDENFKAKARYFQYLNVEQLSEILSQ